MNLFNDKCAYGITQIVVFSYGIAYKYAADGEMNVPSNWKLTSYFGLL